jgi:DNA-binding XRE family transcriptional regulator
MGKTQSWLANETRLSRSEIRDLVNQRISDPGIQPAVRISRALDCPIEELFR